MLAVREGVRRSRQLDEGEVYVAIESPLGPVFVAHGERGISAIHDETDPDAFEQYFQRHFGRPVRRAKGPPSWLSEAFAANWGSGPTAPLTSLKLRFDLRGCTPFEQAVLLKTAEIPRGEIRPYSWVAKEVSHPLAVRAVGSAVGRNPIPLLIPCHRIVRADGKIGNYGLGGDRAKRKLLSAEGIDLAEVESLARAGIRYVGHDVTRNYCYPTCQRARDESAPFHLTFHSDEEATALGFRPCETCRPPG
ncbi:MAG TPA: methylated-DNA--[protein]-cysteine S-methyltransferase [Chloroflexota bacterium]|nr:methylated-DNA--[protein]-cysteine S-methyltransferase [Chloroflexota bacterium]